jgi:hypothetical protein
MVPPICNVEIDAHTLSGAQCEFDLACLSDARDCQTIRFMNRDVEVVRCFGDQPCRRRLGYDGMQICTCPVRKRLHGL